jgi:ubiquinone/menaquinone biosynthesis C-methylase UbiE
MNKTIQRESTTSTKIFDNRTLTDDYGTLLSALRPGLKVLDVGCGTGAISKGIAESVGPTGSVTGIDNTEHFISSGQETYKAVSNLTLLHADLFTYNPGEKFDLIVAARVLQWLNNPKEALLKMKPLLKPGGQVSILDYNHAALEWQPQPPRSMRQFYQAFLKWRADAGMNNRIADDLADYFAQCGFHSIEVHVADEVYKKSNTNFLSKINIWSKVAELKQIVDEGYLDEETRLKAIREYNEWCENGAERMTMKLKEVRGKI